MTLEQYRELMWQYAEYPNRGNNIIYAEHGLKSKVRELSDELKLTMKDDYYVITSQRRDKFIDSLGDCFWYICAITYEDPQIHQDLFLSRDSIPHRITKRITSSFNIIKEITQLINECFDFIHERNYIEVATIFITIGKYLNVTLEEILTCNLAKLESKKSSK